MMIHPLMLVVAVVAAALWRQVGTPIGLPIGVPTWQERWQSALLNFLLPPLLLLSTAVAIVLMGPHGHMVHRWDGWSTYSLALLVLAASLTVLTGLFLEGMRSLQVIRQYPEQTLQDQRGYCFSSPLPYIAQVGFWRPKLLFSQGLLATLDDDHLTAVLCHEQAHQHYHDTFWFFWLGGLRRLTIWLPQTEALWQELLALRELRADRWAAQQVDALLLAEALLLVVSEPLQLDGALGAAFGGDGQPDRLIERIDALLSPTAPEPTEGNWWMVLWVLAPLAIVPFHG
jgi:Zn-dependent protease with chaperone function